MPPDYFRHESMLDNAAGTQTQDRLIVSKRAWATVLAGVTAFLASPQGQVVIAAILPPGVQPLAPTITALLSGALGLWSKAKDKRPRK